MIIKIKDESGRPYYFNPELVSSIGSNVPDTWRILYFSHQKESSPWLTQTKDELMEIINTAIREGRA